MHKLILLLIGFTLSFNMLFAVDATLKIKKDVEQRTHIALIDCSEAQNSKVFKIFLSDFKISGHFLVDTKHYIGDISNNFILPKLKNKEYVLKYKFSQNNSSKLEVKLLNVSNGNIIFSKTYSILNRTKMPFLIHKSVSEVNNILNYPNISWINRYVVYSVYSAPRHSEIYLSDYTFNYKKIIVRGGLNLFPKWADRKQHNLYYTSYKNVLPTLYKLNIYTGTKTKIISSEGMLVCSDVSSDGSKLLLTMAPNAQADIYQLNLLTHSKKRITRFNGIDVNGRYASDENHIIFVSNRLGYPNIFKKSINASGISQMVYHGRNNSSCDAYGDKIIYSSRETNNAFRNNKFNIYLLSESTLDTRPLTTTGSNQFPRFSSDGSVVMFLKQYSGHTSVGYTNLNSYQSLLFPFYGKKVQSIDW